MKTLGDLIEEYGTLDVSTPLRICVRKGVMDSVSAFGVIKGKLVLFPSNPISDRKEKEEPL